MASRLLFLPVSGPTGSGEYMRCLTIAEALEPTWPGVEIEFVLNRHAGYSATCPFTTHLIDTSPTRATAEVNEILRARHPDVVLFDNAGRALQFRRAKELGARTVFISSRATTRRKGFGLRRLRWIDQHWIIGPGLIRGPLSRWERAKLAVVHGPETLLMDWIFLPPEPGRSAALLERLGVEPEGYLLACAGGGGKLPARRVAPMEVFTRSAREVAKRTGLPAIVVRGHNGRGLDLEGEGVVFVETVSRSEMIDLISQARLLMTNGGCVFIESLATRRPCVAVPLATDQGPRVRAYGAAGLAVASGLEAGEIIEKAESILREPAKAEAIRRCLEQQPIVNGLPAGLASLERLLRA